MSYATFGDLTLADGTVTKDNDADFVVVPLRAVDGASVTHKANHIWILAGLASLMIALVSFTSGGGKELGAGFVLGGLVLFAFYSASRRSVVAVRAGSVEITSEVSGNNREVAEEFVKIVVSAAQWTAPLPAGG